MTETKMPLRNAASGYFRGIIEYRYEVGSPEEEAQKAIQYSIFMLRFGLGTLGVSAILLLVGFIAKGENTWPNIIFGIGVFGLLAAAMYLASSWQSINGAYKWRTESSNPSAPAESSPTHKES